MELSRRNLLVYVLLGAVWTLVVVWQAEEHFHVRQAARADLSNRSRAIANTVSACIRGLRFRGTYLPQERLEPVLDELVNGRSNELVKSSELISIALLNAAGEQVASAGRPIDVAQRDILQKGERWGLHTVTFVNPVDLGVSLSLEGGTNPTVVLPRLTNGFRDGLRPPPPPREPPPGELNSGSNAPRPGLSGDLVVTNMPPPPPGHDGPPPDGPARPRRPFWLRNMGEAEY
jgi:hypothetical protein